MFNNGFPKEWSTLRKLAWLYRTVINAVSAVLKTITGNPIHILDALAKPAQALSVKLEPIQDLHGYDNPWPAGGGVNKLPPCVPGTYTSANVTAVVSADGTITITGTVGASSETIIIPLSETVTLPSEKIYLHLLNTANAYVGPSVELSTDIANTTISVACSPANRIYTIPSNRLGVTVDRIRFWMGANANQDCVLHPMICLDNTARSYSPYSNLCPISGHTDADVTRTGKNIVNITAVNSSAVGISWTMNSDGTVTADGTASAFSGKLIADVDLKAGVTYHLSGGVSGKSNFYLYKSGLGPLRIDTGSGANYTPANDIDGVNVYFSVNSGVTVDNLTLYPQIEVGNSGSEWEAYQGQTYPIPLGQTVYGGTLDVLTGVLTVDRAMVTIDGSITGWVSTGYGSANYIDLARIASNVAQASTGFARSALCKTNRFKPISGPWLDAFIQHNEVCFGVSTDNYFVFNTGAGLGDVAAWLAENPIDFVYPLATPQTIQLTPTQVELLQGENNLFSDGEMTLVYLADGNASDIEALNILLGGRYVNNHGADEPNDREALNIILGGNER